MFLTLALAGNAQSFSRVASTTGSTAVKANTITIEGISFDVMKSVNGNHYVVSSTGKSNIKFGKIVEGEKVDGHQVYSQTSKGVTTYYIFDRLTRSNNPGKTQVGK